MADPLVVLITAGTRETASQIAEKLVEEKLAACVNIIPQIESIYRWEGKICRDQELLLIAKTDRDCYERLEAAVLAIHSYTTPEVIALPITIGSAPYLKWLTDSITTKD
jgi:periplasmic divalent cation tolerance protein